MGSSGMPVDHIRYDILAQEALRGVVRRVLSDAARNGLPGEHHFYISFDTRVPGVRLSPRLRNEYPEEMTIVLQHQFWDLSVTDQSFEVALSFHGISERLLVPFAAINRFVDPSVEFGLQFEAGIEEPDEAQAKPPAPVAKEDKEDEDRAPPKRKRSRPARPAAEPPPERSLAVSPLTAPDEPPEQPDSPDGGAAIVRLDRFRKK